MSVGLGPQPDRSGWHEFVVPSVADERTAGSLLDLSFLNPAPTGAHGFLRADGERIVDGRGRAVRLFGSNICDLHVMPPKEEAPRVARRMKQLGMNFTRLHYYDWATAPQGMMGPDNQSLDPAKLDQMDFLIAQLKANGIYVDLNLHVARVYPGTPDGWPMGKGIDYLHEPLVVSQMRFARDVISHVNPYTGRSYADEPAIALFELNNENTALPFWGGGLDRYATLPDAVRKPIEDRFTAFLRRRHGSTDALRRAWNADAPSGPNLLRNTDFAGGLTDWTVQDSEGARSEASVVSGADGSRLLRWVTKARGSSEWNLQIHQPSVPVRDRASYTLRMRARSATSSPLILSLMQQQPPWQVVGGARTLPLTPDWRDWTLSWTVANPGDPPVRLNLSADNRIGEFEVAAMVLRTGQPNGLADGQSLETGVDLVPANGPKTADLLRFLHQTELDYVARMRKLIKEDLGARSMLLCTQVDYGGAAGVAREAAASDLTDVHAYPSHPTRDADGWSWAVRHVSLAEDAFDGTIPLGNVAACVSGKPRLCTEFDLNPPNHFAAETFPYLAIFGSYQGLSGMLDYSWLNFQGGYDHRRINSSFASTGHAGQMAMIPAAMLMYRLGMVRTALATLTLQIPREEAVVGAALEGMWRTAGVPATAALQARMASTIASPVGPARVEGRIPRAAKTIVSDTGEITLDRGERGRETLTVNAPAARCAFGFIVGRPYVLGDVTLTVTQGFERYANVALVAIDGLPIGRSKKLLLTTLARVENRDMEWNQAGTAVRFGLGPTVAEPVHATVALPPGRWNARVLDGNGKAIREMPVRDRVLDTRGAGVWYLLTRP